MTMMDHDYRSEPLCLKYQVGGRELLGWPDVLLRTDLVRVDDEVKWSPASPGQSKLSSIT